MITEEIREARSRDYGGTTGSSSRDYGGNTEAGSREYGGDTGIREP